MLQITANKHLHNSPGAVYLFRNLQPLPEMELHFAVADVVIGARERQFCRSVADSNGQRRDGVIYYFSWQCASALHLPGLYEV